MSCRCHYIFTKILKSVQNNFLGASSIFLQQTLSYTLSHRIHSTHSWNAFSCVHFTFSAFFYLSPWFASCLAATAIHFSCTAVKQNYCSTKMLSRCASGTPIRAPNAIHQTEFDKLIVMRKMHYRRWKLSGWHRSVVLKKCGNARDKLAIFNSTSNSFSNQFLIIIYSFSFHYEWQHEKCRNVFPHHYNSGVAVVLVRVVPGNSFPGGSFPGGSCPRWQLSGWRLS